MRPASRSTLRWWEIVGPGYLEVAAGDVADADLAVGGRRDPRQQPQPDRIAERLEHAGQVHGLLGVE